MYDELIEGLKARIEKTPSVEDAMFLLEVVGAIQELSKKYLASEVDNTNLTGWLAEEHVRNCPHYIRNVHDRGDDSLCDKYVCEVKDVPHWIPVTERLPNENGFYLCLYKHKHPGGVTLDEGLSIRQWYNGKWKLNEIYAVTHWMPIPEPPKEGE